MNITPFSDSCGMQVNGVQLACISDQQLQSLRLAFAEHGLLFFRDQELTPTQHLQFARRFGDIVVNKFFGELGDFPEIAEVRKEADQQTNIGGGWHTDHSYDAEPAMGSILVARELPGKGGDTRFANLASAYQALAAETKFKLLSMRAIHSNEHIYGEGGYYQATDLAPLLKGTEGVSRATHPVVIRHPESSKHILYVNPAHTIQFEGQTAEQSDPLLQELYAHVDQPQFTCQFNWLPGSIAIWDNRSTWHFANNDYDGERRLMHRITLAGTALRAA